MMLCKSKNKNCMHLYIRIYLIYITTHIQNILNNIEMIQTDMTICKSRFYYIL